MKGVDVVVDNTKKLDAAVAALTKNFVYVGIPASKNDEHPERDKEGKSIPIGNAVIGYIMENGSPIKNIPARPHLAPGVKSKQNEIADIYKNAAKLALEGKTEAVMKSHTAVGLAGVSGVRTYIVKGIPPALAESTLAGRRARGRTGETPLIDTADYLHAQSFVVRDR